MIPVPHSPDCRDANHHKCDWKAWDEVRDCLTPCECECHWMTENIRTLP